MDMTADLERGKPAHRDERIAVSEVELIKYRDNRTPLTIKLLTGETLEGAIRWYDEHAIRLVQADRLEVTIFLHAIAYYRTRS